ncbi:UNVERIFIED_CONTAM: hypothetical protein Slati_1588600 [Sesamum latifolium]|uniref:Uncharacterized protein n=1 Tax=Sesamum latifolium TaxID=2727402 RepID=A0AAW2X8L4_9LAMI
MAKSFVCLVFVVVIMIMSNQVFTTEGRRLVAAARTPDIAHVKYESVRNPKHSENERQKLRELDDDDGHMDSYRPTTPGHSPGIGHSKHD